MFVFWGIVVASAFMTVVVSSDVLVDADVALAAVAVAVTLVLGTVVVAPSTGFRRNWEIKMEKMANHNNNQQQIMVIFHFDCCC